MAAAARIRLGLVGCGVVARRHGAWLRNDPRADWRIFCDRNLDAARSFRDAFAPAAEAMTDFATAIGSQSLDAVVLCSPNALHHEQTCAALERGLHVLC